MTEQELIALLGKVQALHDRAGTEGERIAAAAARERLLGRLREEAPPPDPAVEFRLSVHDPWARKLLRALLRRHGLRPYRYARQHRSTIMVRSSARFVNEELWPEFEALNGRLREYLEEATDRIIAAAVHPDSSEAEEVEPARIGG